MEIEYKTLSLVKLCKRKGYFTFVYQTRDVSRLKPQNILFVIWFLDFLSLWKIKQMREGCGLFTLAEWVSTMCKDSALPWCDPHSPADMIEVLSSIPADSKHNGADEFWGGQEFKSLWVTKSCSPPPNPSGWPKYSWHNDVIGCRVQSTQLLLLYSVY